MPQFLVDLFKILMVLVPFIMEAEMSGAENADKRASVIAQVDTILDSPGGIDRPSFVSKEWFDWLLGVMVDSMFKVLKNTLGK